MRSKDWPGLSFPVYSAKNSLPTPLAKRHGEAEVLLESAGIRPKPSRRNGFHTRASESIGFANMPECARKRPKAKADHSFKPFPAAVKSKAYFAAIRIASSMLTEVATPWPATSNAVPWSTEVRRIGIPSVSEMVR